jgi:hypothetical protein
MMSIRVAAYLNTYMAVGAANTGAEIAKLEQAAIKESTQLDTINSYKTELEQTEDVLFLEKLKALTPKTLVYLYHARKPPA